MPTLKDAKSAITTSSSVTRIVRAGDSIFIPRIAFTQGATKEDAIALSLSNVTVEVKLEPQKYFNLNNDGVFDDNEAISDASAIDADFDITDSAGGLGDLSIPSSVAAGVSWGLDSDGTRPLWPPAENVTSELPGFVVNFKVISGSGREADSGQVQLHLIYRWGVV